MAKDKDKAQNPAAVQRKLEKQKVLKKGKAAVAAQRTSRLAHRNPHRLETQIADLHALRDSGGKLSARDQKQLEELERDVARVRKAREKLGDDGGVRDGTGEGRGDGRGGRGERGGRREGYMGLGKRGRDGARETGTGEREGEGRESSEETDEDVKRIPWPRDTPPPVPRRQGQQQQRRYGGSGTTGEGEGTSANLEPLGSNERFPGREGNSAGGAEGPPDTALPVKPPFPLPATKTTYESKAQVRDLRKEATSRFVPQAVRKKIDASKGMGGKLLEEDEVERLEGEGYAVAGGRGGVIDAAPAVGEGEKGQGMDGDEARRLREEEEAFQRVLKEGEESGDDSGIARGVQLEEISDEDL